MYKMITNEEKYFTQKMLAQLPTIQGDAPSCSTKWSQNTLKKNYKNVSMAAYLWSRIINLRTVDTGASLME